MSFFSPSDYILLNVKITETSLVSETHVPSSLVIDRIRKILLPLSCVRLCQSYIFVSVATLLNYCWKTLLPTHTKRATTYEQSRFSSLPFRCLCWLRWNSCRTSTYYSTYTFTTDPVRRSYTESVLSVTSCSKCTRGSFTSLETIFTLTPRTIILITTINV